jgi:hypothetical protein
MRNLLKRFQPLAQKRSAVAGFAVEGAVWTRPELRAEVNYRGLTTTGELHPPRPSRCRRPPFVGLAGNLSGGSSRPFRRNGLTPSYGGPGRATCAAERPVGARRQLARSNLRMDPVSRPSAAVSSRRTRRSAPFPTKLHVGDQRPAVTVVCVWKQIGDSDLY